MTHHLIARIYSVLPLSHPNKNFPISSSTSQPSSTMSSCLLTRTPALDAVFAIPELFTAILLCLSRRDLLLAQRTSTLWKHVISNTPTLQSYLFFAPTSPAARRPRFNPLLARLFPTFFRLGTYHERGAEIGELDIYSTCVDIDDMDWYAWGEDGTARDQILRSEASWRRMFPVQPAVGIGMLRFAGGCQCGGLDHEDAVLAEGLLRERMGEAQGGAANMGLWWDVVVYVAEEWPTLRFFVDWGEGLVPALNRLPELPVDSEEPPRDFLFDVVENRLMREFDEEVKGEGDEVGADERAVMSGAVGMSDLWVLHSTDCYAGRGDEVEETGLRIGDGGFGGSPGKDDVVVMSGVVRYYDDD